MKLLAITNTTDLPEAHLLAALSAQRKMEVCVMGTPSPMHMNLLTDAGVSVLPFKASARFSISAIRAIRAVALMRKPDVIHYFSNRALSNGLIALRGFPVRHIAYRGAMGNVSRWDPLSWATYLHPRLDKIICVSRAVEDYLASVGVAREKLRTIYKGHRLSWYENSASVIPTGVERVPGATVIGCTANMRRVKGVDVLLNAMRSIPRTIPLQLILIGEIRDKILLPLIRTVNDIHPVSAVGFQPNPLPYVRLCDLFVMPSRGREGLPKAVIEAMSQQVAPIVTTVGGMPELVVHNECGLVIEPDSPSSLADAIVTLATNKALATEFGRQSQVRLAEHFSIDATIEQTFETYLEVLGKHADRTDHWEDVSPPPSE